MSESFREVETGQANLSLTDVWIRTGAGSGVGWPTTLDSMVSTVGTEEGIEVGAGLSDPSMTGDWTGTSAGGVVITGFNWGSQQIGRGPIISMAT